MNAHGKRFIRLSLSLMSAALAAGAVNIASAQNVSTAAAAEVEELETVVITGIRGSLQQASEIKRNAVNTVESILAEDVAKMPDLNLAESIQRIPGIAMTREGGEGRNITLRGFAPDFTRTTLNGMEIPASSDGLDSGGFTINAGRSFDFHLFASELFNRIDVQKSQKASIEEGGIAGTVDLYTAKPFDFKERTLVASLQGGHNSLTKKNDPRVALLFSDTYADDTFGVLLSAAVSKRTVHQEGYSSVRWTSPFVNGDSWFDPVPPTAVQGTPARDCPAADPLDCLWAPRLPRADFFGNDQDRIGVTGSFQFRPSDKLLLTFDALHSELTNDRLSYNSMEWLLTHGAPGNFTGQTPISFVVGPDGKQLIAASFNNITSWYESRHQESESKFDQYVLSGNYQLTDRLALDAMVGSAKDDADRTEIRFYYRSVPHFYSYDFRQDPYVPVISFGSYNPNLPSNYLDRVIGADRINTVSKKNVTSRVNLAFDGDSFSLKGGLAYNDRKVAYAEGTGNAGNFAPSAYTRPFPYSNFGSGLDGPGLIPFVVADFDALERAGLLATRYTNTTRAGWRVGEKTLAGYVELNNEYSLGSMLLRANYGIRYVETTVTSQAVVGTTPTTVDRRYDNYLPSMNFALDVTKDITARLAFGRSMTRPGLSSLNIAGPVFGYTTRTVGNLGDPSLKPYESNDVDLGVEWYLANGGVAALGLFSKNIVTSLKTDVVTKFVDPEFWPAIYADPQYSPSFNADPARVPYTFTIPVNSDDGNSVKGYELTYNQPFTFLSGWMKNFGVATNYTRVVAKDSTGLSPNSYNFTVYYDSPKFGARASLNKRDDYLLSQPGGNGHVQERKYGPKHVDFAAFYNLNDHLTISLEAINVTDEIERIYGTGYGSQDLTREYSHTGAQWFLGARYRM